VVCQHGRIDLTIVPANQATWEDLQAVFGTTGEPAHCFCQRYKGAYWGPIDPIADEAQAGALREQTCCDDPDSPETSGLVAFLDGEPAGWCAVEPRSAYSHLKRTPWTGREEDKDDPTVWAVTCFVVRVGYRRQGISGELARAAVDFARERGARALEAYAMWTEPGKDIAWGELHVGAANTLADAGFREVSRPSKRRVVMRIDFA
jgi:GNAT superfamily N-acetyltransferase